MSTDVLIVGAGLSGLVAANVLQGKGYSVTLLDKGRSVGGRLATRRIQDGAADTGAQFFTARTDNFQQLIDGWIEQGLVSIWSHGWSDGSIRRTVGDGHPRYIVNGGMNNLAKHLAQNVNDVQVNVTVKAVSRTDDGWWLTDDAGNSYNSRVLIMTPPVPQTLNLLTDVPLSTSDRKALERIKYGQCICGIFAVDGAVDLPEPGAIQNFENSVYWIADNQVKGISNTRIITAQTNSRFSRDNFDEAEDTILQTLAAELEPYLAEDAVIKEAQLKKWRYAAPLTTHPLDILRAESLPLLFAGDAFGGRGRIEGAYLSGIAAGNTAVEMLAE